MADKIKSEIMDFILRTNNWAMANTASALVLDRTQVFGKPSPTAVPTSLVVPVDVQALYVPKSGHAGENFVRLPMQLGQDHGSAVNSTDPFSTGARRSSGVHLHWALPDGLLRGEMNDSEDDPLALRPLPNRWLVLRMTGRSGQSRLDMKGWIIESERGLAIPLEVYTEGTGAGELPEIDLEALTGVIGGSMSWTSGYDATLNRFALHDDLSDLNVDTVMTGLASYCVIGWWSEQSHDPFANAFLPSSVPNILEKLSWSASPVPLVKTPDSFQTTPLVVAMAEAKQNQATVNLESELQMTAAQHQLGRDYSAYKFDDVTLPLQKQRLQTTMHGVVYGVPIRGGIGRDDAPTANQIDLAMAPTLETAMAAYAARFMGLNDDDDKEYVERLMTAVANSSIRSIASPDGIVALDEAEHGDGFEAFSGPETYEDVVIERSRETLKGGRIQRTKLARQNATPPIKADLMWQGNRKGSVKGSEDI